MIKYYRNLFSLVFVLFCSTVFAYNDHFRITRITTEQKLSNNSISCIFKDSRGFIWIGTSNGLNRYDGYDFVVYKHNPNDSSSISDNFISSIFEDPEGKLWIGTQGTGLNKYDPVTETFTSYFHNSSDPNGLRSDFISPGHTMMLDSDSIMWIGTTEGINLYDFSTHKMTSFHSKYDYLFTGPSKSILSLYQASNGIIWIGTYSGLFSYNKKTDLLVKYDPTTKPAISNEIVTAISENKEGTELWIGTQNGLNVYNEKKNTFRQLFHVPGRNSISDNSITSIVRDGKGNFWIGTKGGGLNKYDPYTNHFISWTNDPLSKDRLSDKRVEYLFLDNQNILWVGFANAGLNLIDIGEREFKLIQHDPSDKNSLSYNTIRSIYEDKNGLLWIGTYGGGLNSYNRKKNIFRHYMENPSSKNGLSNNIITALVEDNSGNLWIGTQEGGLDKLNIATDKIHSVNISIPEFITDLYMDPKENLWIGINSGGIYILNTHTGKIRRFDSDTDPHRKLVSTTVNKILVDHKGNFWIGTWEGLDEIIMKPGKYEPDTIIHYVKKDSPHSINDDRILTVFEDHNYNIWIGTYAGGLNEFVGPDPGRDGKFRQYTEKDGLAGSTVYGILEDNNGGLWISTNNGLSKLDEKKGTFLNYDVSDGLQDNQFYWGASCKSRTGELIFGGINGLNIFNPDSLFISDKFPPLVITDLQIFNKSVPIGTQNEKSQVLKRSITYTKKIQLPRRDYAFSFEFAALVYNFQNKIKYKYRLENFDHNWIYTDASKRFAAYSHLRPGNYIFKLKSTNQDGVWNNKTTEIKVTILPAIWETFGAKLFYVVLILSLLYLFRSQILVRAKFRHDLSVERIEREKNEEYNNMKLRFFTNISHEFRTPLTLIVGPLENLLSKESLPQRIRNQLVIIQNSSKRMLRLINQLMDFRKAETGNLKLVVSRGDIILFIREVFSIFQDRARNHNVKYKLEVPADSNPIVLFDENFLETIIYNLLSNAFKFTPDGGEVRLVCRFQDKNHTEIIQDGEPFYVKIDVSDTGTGIPRDRIENIFKRFYQIEKSDAPTRGTGIGLALCKDLVELHHGTIEVVSEENERTVFTLLLPVHPDLYSEKEITEKKQIARSIFLDQADETPDDKYAAVPGSKETSEFMENAQHLVNAPKILLVDDDYEVIKYLESLLFTKYRIITATNGEKGLQLAGEENPDLIISDIMMPGVSGLDLCNSIKSDFATSHIPVILLTALSDIEDKIAGLGHGADDYISKPFHPEHLRVRISKLIEQRRQLKMSFQKNLKIIPDEYKMESIDEKFLDKILEVIKDNIANTELSVEFLSEKIGISKTHLYRKIKALTGLSTNELIRKHRLRVALVLMESKKGSISEIMYNVGFTSASYFAKCFREEFGYAPSDLGNGKD